MKRALILNSHVMLGLLTAALAVGCGSGSDPGAGDQSKLGTGAAAITERGTTIEGCNATAAFDITSPEAIHFVAVEASRANNMNLELFNVDENGTVTRLDQSAQAVDAAMQSLLDEATSRSSASQDQNRASNSANSHNAATTSNRADDTSASAQANAARSSSTDFTAVS